MLLILARIAVVPFEADYSLQDPGIKIDLDKYQRPGVPMYLIYRPNKPDEPEVLPEVLTPSIVVEGLRRAGPSKLAVRPSKSNVTLAAPVANQAQAASR